MKETFARLWKENMKAYIDCFGKLPSKKEQIAIRKMVITETAMVLVVKEMAK